MYDSKCFDLAEHFLNDSDVAREGDIATLAQYIQDQIELWFGAIEEERDARAIESGSAHGSADTGMR